MLITSDPTTVYKLSPSMLTFLWDGCKRCFWLKARHGIHQPWMPFPSVFQRYHELLQRYFTGRCPSTLHPSLPSGQLLSRETWVQSEPISITGAQDSVYFKGRVDHLMRFDDGTWGLVDYKTTEANQRKAAKYARQLHAYAWALERAAEGEASLAPITRMGLLCLEPGTLLSFIQGEQATAELRPVWIEIEQDDARFERFLGRVAEVLARSYPPKPSSGCSCCTYFRRRTHFEQQLAKDTDDGLPF